ncbi:ABC1 kinase family protein [Methanobacterium alcaliphilum]|uniref:ABC1 kinase family protein n=1 Tax=Methanobacterium alcaliphilum TaxID=392018 RepID=UPI00200A2938|nr:AarF/ABC1/UbiB kinase family protein [Methanobacterium alcaliphilum]MCK9152309.1 AarF/ABC1/UbiB kinase family protein [Methanobacterium alcaliphilum]
MNFRKSSNPHLNRVNEILKVLSKYEFGYVSEKIKLKHKIPFINPSNEYESLEELDESFPIRVRMVFQELGTTYIKLGQTLSTRPDLVGRTIASELTKLQDDNPALDFDTIKKIVEKELKKPINTVFKEFNEEPLGSASIGQVHQAVLKSGEKVAVKVQKPGVKKLIKSDLAIMRFLAIRIDNYIPSARNYNLPGIVDEFERSILKEIDYEQEFRNIKRFEDIFKDDDSIYVPKTYHDYSTFKVLTMELIEGEKISNVIKDSKGFDRKLLARRGVESYFKQIMLHGFFHADPHPANIYVLEDNVICFLDYGMMGILDKEFRENLAELFIYFIENSVKGIINQLIYMGIIDAAMDTSSLKTELNDLMYKYYGSELTEVQGGMNSMINIMRKYHISLPSEFVLLARGIAMLEETGQRLDPQFNTTKILQPMARKILHEKLTPFKLIDFIKDNLFEFEHLLKIVPRTFTKTLYRLEEGKIQIEIEHKDLDRISNKISIALILSALLIGSSLIMQTDKGILILGFPFLGIIGFIISAILGLMLILSVLKRV